MSPKSKQPQHETVASDSDEQSTLDASRDFDETTLVVDEQPFVDYSVDYVPVEAAYPKKTAMHRRDVWAKLNSKHDYAAFVQWATANDTSSDPENAFRKHPSYIVAQNLYKKHDVAYQTNRKAWRSEFPEAAAARDEEKAAANAEKLLKRTKKGIKSKSGAAELADMRKKSAASPNFFVDFHDFVDSITEDIRRKSEAFKEDMRSSFF